MEHLYGTDVWQFTADRPEETTVFNTAMSALSSNSLAAIVGAYDFDRFDRIVDVGGGNGTLLTEILSVCRRPHAVVSDLPHIVEEAAAVTEDRGLGHRCEVSGNSYLDSVPGGGDLYVLKSVLMDCPDDTAAVILRNVRAAMDRDGTVLVIEAMIAAPNQGQPAAFSDLNMLVATGGRIRGRDDWRVLLSAAGFDLVDVTPTTSSLRLIEARPTYAADRHHRDDEHGW
jgi:hypothetical protein